MAIVMTLSWYVSAIARTSLFSFRSQSPQFGFLVRPPLCSSRSSFSSATMMTTGNNLFGYNVRQQSEEELKVIFEEKRVLRSKIRRGLKVMDPALRSAEDDAIQSIVLDAPWFKSSQRLCAYISCSALREVDSSRLLSEILHPPADCHSSQPKKKLYVPRVEDKNSHMRMLHISRMDDLIANSMNILEPSPVDFAGNEREDVMLSNDPVDLFLLPGLAFDKSGRRIGRGGGYYDNFLKNYQEVAKARNWKRPFLVALSYSSQIMEEGIIPVTSNDIRVDALVSPTGVIPISSDALDRGMNLLHSHPRATTAGGVGKFACTSNVLYSKIMGHAASLIQSA